MGAQRLKGWYCLISPWICPRIYRVHLYCLTSCCHSLRKFPRMPNTTFANEIVVARRLMEEKFAAPFFAYRSALRKSKNWSDGKTGGEYSTKSTQRRRV